MFPWGDFLHFIFPLRCDERVKNNFQDGGEMKKKTHLIQQIKNGFFNLFPFPFIFSSGKDVVTLL